MEWKNDIGLIGGKPVAFVHRDVKRNNNLVVKVQGGADDSYFTITHLFPDNSASRVAAKQIAEIVYRITRNQPDQDAAQAAIRAYARLKGDQWWDDK
jgi:hypothetical protein